MITFALRVGRLAAMGVSVVCASATLAGGQQPTADDVIARYVDARGGLEKMKAIHTVIYHGVYREGSHVSDNAAMSLMRPYYKLVGDAALPASTEFAEGYDGSAWEFYGDPGIVVRTVGAASAAGRHAVYIDGPLVDYKERGWTVSVNGTADVGGRKAWRLLIRMPDGFEQEELIDTETWLLIAERKTASIHAFGDKVASETRFSDYRAVDGVLFAFSNQEVAIGTGAVLNEMRWTSIVANVALNPAAFSPAERIRTPLQVFLEQLYAERADVSAVMWSYNDFTVAHPGMDTHDGVQAIGYQMLKMGDVRSALELLKQNAVKYPATATAAFGLGRAYEAAHDLEHAREEYQRALKLDPQYDRARASLEAIKPPT